MQTSPNGIALLHHFEGCKLKAYPDPKTGGAPWTIGYGHTGPDVHEGLVWTQKQADAAFIEDIAVFEDIAGWAIDVDVTQGQWDAFVSILYNVGPGSKYKDGIVRLKNGKPSTLLRKLNARDYAGCKAEFGKWISKGSAVENGLRRRRAAEALMFDGDDWRKAL